MKLLDTQRLAIVAAFCVSVHAQNIPWTVSYGPAGSTSGQGIQHCRQQQLRQGDQYGFQTGPAQPVPINNAPNPQGAQCSLRTTMSKDWERRDSQCAAEKDRNRKDQCYDRLTKDKKNEKDRVDECLKRRERECGAVSDSNAREGCFRDLDNDRAGRPSTGAQQPQQQQKPQTKCCLRLFSDNQCKNRVFEACNSGNGIAQGDASGWTVVCG